MSNTDTRVVGTLRAIVLLSSILAMGACSSGGTATDTPVIDGNIIDSTVIDIMNETGADRASVAVKSESDSIYARAYGAVTDQNQGFALASLSKLVTAYAILKMADDGILQLSDPVMLYVPELATLPNSERLDSTTLLDLLSHNSTLAQVSSYNFVDWQARLTAILALPAVSGNAYANDNYTLLTRVIMNLLGSYQSALDMYINVGGINSFTIGQYHGIPSYAGVGELESSAADFLRFAQKSAPLSTPQSGTFGIGWFHNPAGYLDHTGIHILSSGTHYAIVVWNATTMAGRPLSFVYQADAIDDEGRVLPRLMERL